MKLNIWPRLFDPSVLDPCAGGFALRGQIPDHVQQPNFSVLVDQCRSSQMIVYPFLLPDRDLSCTNKNSYRQLLSPMVDNACVCLIHMMYAFSPSVWHCSVLWCSSPLSVSISIELMFGGTTLSCGGTLHEKDRQR